MEKRIGDLVSTQNYLWLHERFTLPIWKPDGYALHLPAFSQSARATQQHKCEPSLQRASSSYCSSL
jgi:hypothetical protein